MAKSVGPLLSLSAHGTVGGALTYQKSGKGHKTYRKSDHKDAKSAAQKTQRALFDAAVDSWQALDELAREAWRWFAKGKAMSGFNLYLSHYLRGKSLLLIFTLDVSVLDGPEVLG